MKRTLHSVLLGLCLVFLCTNGANSARQATQKQAPPGKLPAPNWIPLTKRGDGKALRLWETRIGPEWPQVAVLQLSKEKHQELEQDPLAFIKKYKIFGDSKVDGVRGHSELVLSEEKTPGDDPDRASVVVVVHDITTYAGYASFDVAAIQPIKP